jgi:hypothetical protein
MESKIPLQTQQRKGKVEMEMEIEEFDIEELMEMLEDGVAETICGCIVELDGICPCGNESVLITLGMI